MDGNGRGAKVARMPRIAGHRRGDAVRRCRRAAIDLGISYLTLYGFFFRELEAAPVEIDDPWGCCALSRAEIAELHRGGVRLRVDRRALAPYTIS